MSAVYIGLGSNLADPIEQVRAGINELSLINQCALSCRSALYRSPPMGPADQPDYINAVVMLETSLSPLGLLDELQKIERLHKRVRREVHWGPRTLDLDILSFDALELNDERLTLPHPGIAERAFVVVPLFEIAPDLRIPGVPALSKIVATFASEAIQRIA